MKKRILLLCLFCMTLGFAYSQEPDPQITNMTKVVICTSDKKSLIKAESLKEIFLDSSMVERTAVNRDVVGSSPTRGVFLNIRLRGQAVKTSPFHGGNTGSIPVGVI